MPNYEYTVLCSTVVEFQKSDADFLTFPRTCQTRQYGNNGIKSAVGFLKKVFLLCVPYVLLFIARQTELTGNTSPRESPRLITW